MNIRIVGGDFKQTPKRSSVIDKAESVYLNVCMVKWVMVTRVQQMVAPPEQLEHVDISGHDPFYGCQMSIMI